MAESTTIPLADVESFKRKALIWAAQFRVVCLLDNNNYPLQLYPNKNWLLAVDAATLHNFQFAELHATNNAFERLKAFQQDSKASIFGFFSYDLKNQIENLESDHIDRTDFPEMYFFKPRYLFEIDGNKLTVNRNYPETFEIVERIESYSTNVISEQLPTGNGQLFSRTARHKYLQNVELIKQQITAGDFYELNYCNEFYIENAQINPVDLFSKLNDSAKAPFSCFFKLDDKYLLCASPERFLKKEGSKLISQPIKGTVRKGATIEEDEALKQALKNDVKERAENVMIVDLVRNDLARSSQPGSVKVEELFGVYGFNAVNQMISTITGGLDEKIHFIDAIKNAFPMGSMTGAPKVEVMKNIERYEDFKRGIYSGSVGYIEPDGDFDFNVVIRSIIYNATNQYLSVRVGGAITYDSIAEKEYEEMLLKAKGMMDVLGVGFSTD